MVFYFLWKKINSKILKIKQTNVRILLTKGKVFAIIMLQRVVKRGSLWQRIESIFAWI